LGGLAGAIAMPSTLLLRRANVFRRGGGGDWSHNDFDVFDGEREVGRIYLIDKLGDEESWFWDVSFMLTGRRQLWPRVFA
jgi:hypothetical protein